MSLVREWRAVCSQDHLLSVLEVSGWEIYFCNSLSITAKIALTAHQKQREEWHSRGAGWECFRLQTSAKTPLQFVSSL